MRNLSPARDEDDGSSMLQMESSAATPSIPRCSEIRSCSPGRDPHFRLWFAADTFQMMSQAFTAVALPLLAVAMTASSTMAGLVVAAGAAGSSLALLPGGMLADQLDRSRLVVFLAGLGAIVYGLIVVFCCAVPSADAAWLASLAFFASLFQAMAAPAFSATLKCLIPAHRFAAAASLSEGRSAALGLAVPVTGGALYVLGGWIPFAIAAFVTLLAAYLYHRLPARVTASAWANAPVEHRGFWSGILFVIRNRTLSALVLMATLVNFAASTVVVATVFYLRSRGVSAAVVGLSTSVLAMGSLCGAAIAACVASRVPGGHLVALCLLWIVAMFIPTGVFASNTIAVIILLALAILAAPTLNAVFGGYLVAKVPPELQGRVDSAVSFFASFTAPLAPLLAGFGLEVKGYPGVVGLCVAIVGLAGVPILTCRGIRDIPCPDRWGSGGSP